VWVVVIVSWIEIHAYFRLDVARSLSLLGLSSSVRSVQSCDLIRLTFMSPMCPDSAGYRQSSVSDRLHSLSHHS